MPDRMPDWHLMVSVKLPKTTKKVHTYSCFGFTPPGHQTIKGFPKKILSQNVPLIEEPFWLHFLFSELPANSKTQTSMQYFLDYFRCHKQLLEHDIHFGLESVFWDYLGPTLTFHLHI